VLPALRRRTQSVWLAVPKALTEVVHDPLSPPYFDELDVDVVDRNRITLVSRLTEREESRTGVRARGDRRFEVVIDGGVLRLIRRQPARMRGLGRLRARLGDRGCLATCVPERLWWLALGLVLSLRRAGFGRPRLSTHRVPPEVRAASRS